ncbi:MAG: Unknown protein [uncultured Sulfurovum sp.]|uniref:Four helix bundle protein n=1 Tax=uncultured Sulfurovum sp. TaxID=269237 RepID=A0A6S6TV34_9BACT|nr:MAG: Unknown protein [uncultured Sulfurovum sp.]
MGNENLPIYKSALSLAVYMEQIVRGFEKYHKYTMGVDLRQKSKALLFAISRANLSQNKVDDLVRLRDTCEEMKMLIQLSKELKAFKDFKQFEHSSLLSVTVCKQAQAWLKSSQRNLGGVSKSQSLQMTSVKRATFTVRYSCLCA